MSIDWDSRSDLVAELATSSIVSQGFDVVDIGGTTNLNLLVRGTIPYVVRVYRPWTGRRRITGLRNLRRLLEQYGLRVPKPILINGHEVFKVLGFWAEAESYLPHLPAQVGQYPQIFAALGELHQAMLRCWVSTIPEPRFPNYGTIVQLKTWLQGSVERMEITANERETIQRVSYAIQTLSNLEQRYLPSLPHVPVHGDYTHSNIGFTADGEPVYLDFDVASLKPRVHDLAYAAVIMLRRMQYPLDPQATSWDLVWDMVDIYEQSVPVPLTSLERWAFPIEMVRVNLCSAARAAFPSLHESSWLVLMHGLAEAECILRSSM